MSFKANMIEKMRGLVSVYYQLHSNGPNYLKTLQTGWTFLDLNPDKVYDITICDLKLALLIISSWKMADLQHP